MYPAIFIQFFCDFHTVFFAHPINLKGLVVFLYFSKTNSYFQGWFNKIPGQFQDKRHFFQIPGVFQDQGQIFQVCANPVRACLILYAISTPKFNLWIYVEVMECRSLFSSTSCDLDLRSQFLKKIHPQQIAYFIYWSIPYLLCRYILDPGESTNVSRSLWPWPLVSVLARSSSEHICI